MRVFDVTPTGVKQPLALTLRVGTLRFTLSRLTAGEGKADGVSRRAAGEGKVVDDGVL